MTKRCDPRVCPQLTAVPTAGEDCGVRTVQRAIRWASCGKVFIKVGVIRQRMGKPAGPTNPPDWLTVMRHPDTVRAFQRVGLRPPESHLRGVTKLGFIVGSPVKTAIDALEGGKLICVAESYLPWHGTKYDGSGTFTGNHAVSYFDFDGDAGDGSTSMRYDSLADGRRPGIAKGPDKVPWSLIEESMGKLDLDTSDARRPLGAGKWAGMVVERALPLKEKPAPPTCDEQLAELRAQLEALEDADDDDGAPPADAPVVEGVTAAAAGPADVEDV
jgi:hypothetical protein